MKKILILFSLIGCLSFAEEFKCRGDKDKDVTYLTEAGTPILKKLYVALSTNDKVSQKEARKKLKEQIIIVDHILKKHIDDLSLQEIESLVTIRKDTETLIQNDK